MRTVVGILLLTFVVLLDSIESTSSNQPDGLAELFKKLRITANLITGTRGIFYYGTKNGSLVDIRAHGINISAMKVIEQGFVIGLDVNNELAPIYDESGTAIAVRYFDSKNIPLLPSDLIILRYYRPVPPAIIPASTPPTLVDRSEQLAEVFRNLRETANIISGTRGIYYYGTRNGEKVNILKYGIDVFKIKVVEQGFVIGLDRNNELTPIYDKNGTAIVVRDFDSKNIPLSPRDLMILPYYRPIRLPLVIPHHRDAAESSAQAEMRYAQHN